MEQEIEATEAVATEAEATPEQAREARSEYDLHIKVPADMRQKLRDCAELAYKMGDISKPDLVHLMNLFINWGMAVLKKKWLDRVGYR
jgi:hypothetical protein